MHHKKPGRLDWLDCQKGSCTVTAGQQNICVCLDTLQINPWKNRAAPISEQVTLGADVGIRERCRIVSCWVGAGHALGSLTWPATFQWNSLPIIFSRN